MPGKVKHKHIIAQMERQLFDIPLSLLYIQLKFLRIKQIQASTLTIDGYTPSQLRYLYQGGRSSMQSCTCTEQYSYGDIKYNTTSAFVCVEIIHGECEYNRHILCLGNKHIHMPCIGIT